jgi:hypothetical protein
MVADGGMIGLKGKGASQAFLVGLMSMLFITEDAMNDSQDAAGNFEALYRKLGKKIKDAHQIFTLAVFLYIWIFASAVQVCRFKLRGQVWCYFGLVIGLIYVFFAFYYFFDSHLLPYVEELKTHSKTLKRYLQEFRENPEKLNKRPEELHRTVASKERSVFFWLLEWILPAMAVQFFIFVGFWMTVATIPFSDYMYTHPYMYGQVYKKMENYLSPEIPAAGLAVIPSQVIGNEMKEKLSRRGQTLENEFSGYVRNWTAPEDKTDQGYLNDIIRLISAIYKIPFYIALTFSFLGTLMYTLNNASYRFLILDLYPKTYVGYLIRFIFAPALSLVIAYFLMNDWWTNGAPALFFFVGFFPQLALLYIEDKVRTFLKQKKEKREQIPLGLIQGVTDYIGYRLKELGVGDAQNLAYCDLNFLRKNWCNDRLLCDFVAQALMLIHLREDFSRLQDAGIRNIIAFKKILSDSHTRQQFAEKLGIREKLDAVMGVIDKAPLSERIDILEKIIQEFDRKEIGKLLASGVAGS